MKLSQFKFDLPLNLIAQHPTKKREDARMMVVHRRTGQIENKHFRDIMDYFDDKDVFVVVDAPDNVSAAAVALAVNASGLVSTTTTPLLTPEEVDEATKKSVKYRAPGQ